MMPAEPLDVIVRDTLAAAGGFRPFAVFDELLDCIRVVTRDCSTNEIRVNEELTLLEANYPVSGKREIVGFTIKGVAHLCETCHIPPDAPWKLADFLNAIMARSPLVHFMVEEHVQAIVEETQLEDVELITA
jgi:hypothetical protein